MVIRSMNDLAKATKTDVSISDEYNFSSWRVAQGLQQHAQADKHYDAGVDLDQTLKGIDEVLIGEANKGQNSRISQEQLDASRHPHGRQRPACDGNPTCVSWLSSLTT